MAVEFHCQPIRFHAARRIHHDVIDLFGNSRILPVAVTQVHGQVEIIQSVKDFVGSFDGEACRRFERLPARLEPIDRIDRIIDIGDVGVGQPRGRPQDRPEQPAEEAQALRAREQRLVELDRLHPEATEGDHLIPQARAQCSRVG